MILEAVDLLPIEKRPDKAFIFKLISLGVKITAICRSMGMICLC
jgi:hypothetical protein